MSDTRTAFRTCPLCEATCGLEITLRGDEVIRIRGDRDDVFSHGYICPKGSTLKQLEADPDVLRRPQVRAGATWNDASWAEAFATVEEGLLPILERHGRDAVAVYLGNPNVHNLAGQLAVRPLLKALGTRNIFSASTVDQMPKHLSSGLMFGDPLAIPVPDLDRTSYLFMLGANPWESNGSLATAPDWPGRMLAIRERGGKVVVVDPRRTKTAEHADEHVPIQPGTDALLLAAMVGVLFDEGRVDPGPIGESIDGVETVRDAVAPFTPERVAAATGVPAATITRLAGELAAAPSAAVYGRIGTHTAEFGTLASWLVDVLNVLTGNLDRPGGAMFATPAHLPVRRPGRTFRSGRWASRVRQLPEVLGELPVSTLADEIETPGEGQVRALLTVAGNPVLSTPNSGRLDRALGSLEFMVSVDLYRNETTRHADVILPPPTPLRRSHYDLLFSGLAVRNVANYSPAVLGEADGQIDEWDILVRLTAIAAGLGAEIDTAPLEEAAVMGRIQQAASDPTSPVHGRDPVEIMEALGDRRGAERVLDLMLRLGAYGDGFGSDPEGLSLALLEEHPHGVDFGPLHPRLADTLRTESGLVDLAPAPILADIPRLAALLDRPIDGPVLVGRRHLRSNNSWMHNLEVLVKGRERCTLEVHPDDARRWGLADGAEAQVSSAAGTVVARVEVTDTILPGVVSLPHGWGHDLPGVRLEVAAAHSGVGSNHLSDETIIDPLSGNAVLNGIPVTVGPA